MREKMLKVIEYLEEAYNVGVDCCGEEDEISTIPAKEALEAAKEVLSMIE